MPYNTRRKSLSLPSLGIHVPNTSRSHRSPSIPKGTATTDTQQPPSKKVKRSHDEGEQPSGDVSGARAVKSRRPSGALEHTPPPSPADSGTTINKIDTEGITDDIVVAVIEQLEKTGNRPHLIKELATVLASTNDSIANSANAAALISSRLSLYLKRPWTALAPCPIAKELIPVHPRKVFFYLTNSPHQPLPQDSFDIIAPTVESKQITPSVSVASNAEDGDEDMERERARLSPSPEVDLSNPEFDEAMIGDGLNGSTPGAPPSQPGSFSAQYMQKHNHRLSHNHRSASPPLEGDEKEFTQTASSVRERASAEDIAGRAKRSLDEVDSGDSTDMSHSTMDTDADYTQSQSQDREYDYFSSHFIQDSGTGQQLETATESDLFNQSRSPSTSSDVSSLSSATSVSSNGDLERTFEMKEDNDEDCSNGLKVEPTVPACDVSKMDTSALDSGISTPQLTPADIEMSDPMAMVKPTVGFNFTHVLESWGDLQSPETVEIHELDAIFADI